MFEAARSGSIPAVVVVIVPVGRPGTAFVKKDHCLMGRDFKACYFPDRAESAGFAMRARSSENQLRTMLYSFTSSSPSPR